MGEKNKNSEEPYPLNNLKRVYVDEHLYYCISVDEANITVTL